MKKTAYFLAILFLPVFLFSQSALIVYEGNELDSLKALLKNTMHDTSRIRILYQLTDFAPEGEWQQYSAQVKSMTEQRLERGELPAALERFYREFLARSYFDFGQMHRKKNSDSSIYWFKKSLSVSEKYGFKSLSASNYFLMGNYYSNKADFKAALTVFYKGLKTAEEIKDVKQTAYMLSGIGEIYHSQGEIDTALVYFNRSLGLHRQNKDITGTLNALNYVALMYVEKDQYSEAKKYYVQILQLANGHGTQLLLSDTYINYGYVIEHQGQIDSALHYYKKALQITGKLNNNFQAYKVASHLGNAYLTLKNYNLALQYGRQALLVAKKIRYQRQIMAAYQILYNIYKASGKSGPALEMYENYIRIKDTVQNDRARQDIIEQKLKYDFEKKEIIAKAESDKKISTLKITQQQESKTKNIWMGLLISLSLLLIGSVGFVYIYFRQKTTISGQKNNILKQKLQLSQMNPHFIFNSLNAIQNYIFKEDKLSAGLYLAKFSELIRMILNFSRKDYISLESEEKFLNNYLEVQKIRFVDKLTYTIHIDEKIDKEEIFLPPMLAQPFIENAIEHGILNKEGAGHISITFALKNDLLIYEIEDDGIGLEKALALKSSLVSSYESLGTVITKDRITGLNSRNKKEILIEITDLSKQYLSRSGVKVKFSVPYKLQ